MTSNPSLMRRLSKGDLAIPFYFSMANLLLHFWVNWTGGYGFFRDEFYYIACSKELAAGYVDQPPLCAFALRIAMMLFGDSEFAVRLVAALAGAGSVFVVGLIAIRLGGRRLATFVSCLISFSPIYLAMCGYYSMNAIDIFLWILAALVVIKIIQEESPYLWLSLGVILGLGLLNKIGVLFLGVGIFSGLLFTSQRKWLTTRWPYLAGVIAFVFFLPYIIWNIQNSFAHLEFIHNASTQKYSSQSALSFLSGQLLINNPIAIFFWIPGLIALLTADYFRSYRILGWMFVGPLLIFVINGTSKAEYLAPAYGVLFAAGGVFWERLIIANSKWRYAFWPVLALWIVFAITFLPMVLPVLPVEKYISYADAIGFKPASSEGKEQSELPQYYADMFGWKEKAKGVAEVYHKLSDEDKKKCAIFASNYGRCASIDYYAKEYDLPRTIGNHNNYWIWGPRGYTGEVVIILGGSLEDHQPNFEKVTLEGVVDCQYCMPYEDNVPIFLCRNLKVDLEEIWAQEKHFE